MGFLIVVAVNTLAVGWWWLQHNQLSLESSSRHVTVPHPSNHIEENRKLHEELMGESNGKFERDRENSYGVDTRHHRDLEKKPSGESNRKMPNKSSPKEQQPNKITSGNLHKEEEDPKTDTQQRKKEKPPDTDPSKRNNNNKFRQSLLNCSAHGGPYDFASVDEMVYWKVIPEDLNYRSRFAPSTNDTVGERFLTFDTDLSGFNNQRMVFEINLVTAIVTGRTLVLPRESFVDHMEKKDIHATAKMSMGAFFDIPGIAQQMPGILKVATIDDFIETEGTPDKLHIPTNFTDFYKRMQSHWSRNYTNGAGHYEVNTNGTNYHDKFLLERLKDLGCDVHKKGAGYCSHYKDWIDERHKVYYPEYKVKFFSYFMDEYLSDHPRIAHPRWGASLCLLTIPNATTDVVNTGNGQNKNKTATRSPSSQRFSDWTAALYPDGENYLEARKRYVGNPVGINAPAIERLPEVYQLRSGLCVYDAPMHAAKYYHMVDRPETNSRLIGHWYDYLFFEDWKEDLWAKRFIRDRVRYGDELQCAAARIVERLREIAALVSFADKGTKGTFHAYHIRRTDLTRAYRDLGVDKNATEILGEFTNGDNKDILPKDSVVYIATDESDKSFFDAFRKTYRKVYFLDDFVDLLGPDFPKEYYGMIDQLVCTRSDRFVGTFYSTFTGYINRLRGYHTQKTIAAAPTKHAREEASETERDIREQGTISSWFYAPAGKIGAYREYEPIGRSLFEMEYAMAWRNIDYGVDPVLTEAIDKDALVAETVADNQRGVAAGMERAVE